MGKEHRVPLTDPALALLKAAGGSEEQVKIAVVRAGGGV